ncbi:MAG: hypothetical protein DRJ43_04010 [Thermoprotei archaeon]|nr:MAG: hypothetical protein DRJ43_04010 [Thermoprotei archaeon]
MSVEASGRDSALVKRIEVEHVVRVFDEVAAVYDRGRSGWYRGILELLEGRVSPPLLDAGCGTGLIASRLALRGLDCVVCLEASRSMLRVAWRRALRWGVGGFIHPVRAMLPMLPLRSSSFRSAVALAVIHHVYGRSRRVRALRELLRVVKEGTIMVTVWSLLTPENLARYLGEGLSRDVIVPWRRGGRALMRYYHLYTPGELREDLEAAGFREYRVYAWDYRKRVFKRNLVAEAQVGRSRVARPS